MKRKDITKGDVLAWSRYVDRDQNYSDSIAIPVRVVDVDREVPKYANAWSRTPIGTRKATFIISLKPDLVTPIGEEYETSSRSLIGQWSEVVARRDAHAKAQAKLEAQHQADQAAREAAFEHVGVLSDPSLRRGQFYGANVTISPVDLLALIKAARTAALNEFEGTGGRNG